MNNKSQASNRAVAQTQGDRANGGSSATIPANDPIHILVLGPRSCGKTAFIHAATSGHLKEIPLQTGHTPTKEFKTFSQCSIKDRKVVFLDSPGFESLADLEGVLSKLITYLDGKPLVTGIIYIHPDSEEQKTKPGALHENLQRLRAFIGAGNMEWVTTLVKPREDSNGWEVPARAVLAYKSPFTKFYRNCPHPKILPYKLDRPVIHEAIRPYFSEPQGFLHAQEMINDNTWKLDDLAKHLKDESQKKSDAPQVKEEAKTSSGPESQSGQEPKQHLSSNGVELPETTYKDEVEKLRTELKQTEKEYASLRSHLQVHDNVEHGDITQTFGDINRQIEDLGQSLSDYLVEAFEGHITSFQDLETSKFQLLAELFSHTEGASSLMKSSTGSFPEVDDFLFYATRAMLCNLLYVRLFEPFHPCLAGQQHNEFILEVYKQITLQEPQSVAGRWRKDTFNSISKSSVLSHQDHAKATCGLILGSLEELIRVFVGPTEAELYTEEHKLMLTELVALAEAWNQRVKGVVVFHGDFQPVTFPYGTDFQANSMSEEGRADSNSNRPKISLAIVELGLTKTYAHGGYREPEKTVLRKAMAVTEGMIFKV